MIAPSEYYSLLKESEIEFFTGVPDSVTKELCNFLQAHVDSGHHVIAANEGAAVALAAGWHLASGSTGMVYMQNSGLGNALNPLLSMASRTVYQIPMLLLIGWRGEGGIRDEAQHLLQGAITRQILDLAGIPNKVLPPSRDECVQTMRGASAYLKEYRAPFAILVRNGTFESMTEQKEKCSGLGLTRLGALKLIRDTARGDAAFVATTGYCSRELYELTQHEPKVPAREFLNVGAMGHGSQIALGIAVRQPDRPIWMLDGDGAAIMHMGAFATIGKHAGRNFVHVLFNNQMHESVGGQPTAANVVDFPNLARSCGYKWATTITSESELQHWIGVANDSQGPGLMDIRQVSRHLGKLGRPNEDFASRKRSFMDFLLSNKSH